MRSGDRSEYHAIPSQLKSILSQLELHDLCAVIFLQRLQGGKFPPWLEFFPPWKKFPLNAIRMGGVTIAPSETWASPDF